ncbi:peptidyl-tRNA hydrolase Pth2 [Candidatus Nanohalovita haloferacivicina]|uniref:peptidyl-tRNA hydrolase Pth2 n=1 Tax=Candidatus Nanohalovita haloferacivicina TaxID=2978046 RepID=UPI00325FD149
MTQYKQAIVLQEDLNMSKGKSIAQACHASLKAYERSEDKIREKWDKQGAKKVALDIGNKDIRVRFQKAKDEGLPAYLVKDAGRTELKSGTVTALGIGPAEESKIDSITGDLGLIE